MSHQVLSRAYRPSVWDEVVGQEHVVRVLVNALKRDPIPPTWIFSGQRGTGKTTLARIFGKAIQCENRDQGFACGTCTTCKTKESRIALIEHDAASYRSVKDVQPLVEDLALAPIEARAKVLILDEVHMFSEQAFSVLLKITEEPPPHLFFIMCTTEPNQIPETLHSRAMSLTFKPVRIGACAERLQSLATKEDKILNSFDAKLIASRGTGSIRDSESLLEQVLLLSPDVKEIPNDVVREVAGYQGEEDMLRALEFAWVGDSTKTLESIQSSWMGGLSEADMVNALIRVVSAVTYGIQMDAVDIDDVDLKPRLWALHSQIDKEIETQWLDWLWGASPMRDSKLHIEIFLIRVASSRRKFIKESAPPEIKTEAESDISLSEIGPQVSEVLGWEITQSHTPTEIVLRSSGGRLVSIVESVEHSTSKWFFIHPEDTLALIGMGANAADNFQSLLRGS